MIKPSNVHISVIVVFVLLFIAPCLAQQTGHTGSQTAHIPAVMQTEMGFKGVMATVTVDIVKGTGHVYVDTLPLAEIDTQSSARLAKEVSGNMLGIDMNQYDLLFTIRSDSPIIGGPSAGGSITALTIATLLNLSMDKKVVMTGTINPDGSIGPVGGILEKAEAVAKIGGKTFLIPEGQSMVTLQKTERLVGPGSIQIKTQTKLVDVKKYAEQEWGLNVIEVGNVRDALKYMTGYEIKTRSAKKLKKSETVDEIMKNMAQSFIADVEQKYDNAKKIYEQATVPLQYKEGLQNILDEQTNNINTAKQFFEEGKYYSASSKAFYSGIQLSYVKNMANVLSASSISKAVQNVINNADDMIDIEEKLINTSVINSITDIEIISATEERLDEAKKNLEDARQLFYSMQYADAVYAASYAMERSNSAVVWYDLINNFNETDFNFSYDSLQALAQRRVEDADTAIVYAQTIGIDTTAASSFVETARSNLDEGLYSSALSNAVMGKANANLLMETRGIEDLSTKITSYDKSALNAIEDAQTAGAVPILALSYYEFANSFDDKDDIGTKLLYLKYSKEFASLSLDLISLNTEGIERQVDIEIAPVASIDSTGFAIIGFFAGIMFLFFVLKFGRWL